MALIEVVNSPKNFAVVSGSKAPFASQNIFRAQKLIFPPADRAVQVFNGHRSAPLFFLQGPRYQINLIARVHNANAWCHADGMPMFSQDFQAETVKRTNGQILGPRGTDKFADAPSHFPGSFVGKGHGGNVAGGDALLHHPRHAGGDHPCFTSSSASKDQHWPVEIFNSRPLLGV